MRMENLGFGEALRRLAQMAGITLPTRGPRSEVEVLYQINEAAREFFSRLLASPEGAGVRAYLQGRGLSQESVERFQLGLSPRDGEALKGYLTSRGFSEGQIALAGLVTQTQDGRYRDLFRGRLMFPIRDDRGLLAGFGGRALDDSTPKYLNSPRTPIFDKGQLLYGLHLAREGIRQKGAVVVEGYMDVIIAHQYGFSNVVASMGTSFTGQQAALLKGLAGRVAFALDPDVAGEEATLRGLESSWQVFQRQVVARARGVTLYERAQLPSLSIVPLPRGKDPDEIIRESPEAWERLVAGAVPLMDYLFSALAQRFDLTTSQGKARVAELLFPLVAAIEEPFEQEHYFRRLATLLGVSEATLEASLGRPRPATGRQAPARRRAIPTPFGRLERDPLEEHCLALLLKHPELGQVAQGLRPEHFQRVENRELFNMWIKCSTMDELMESLDEELKEHLDGLLGRELPPADGRERERVLRDCVRRLEARRLRELKMEEELRLSQAPPGELYEREVLELNERIRRLFLEKV
jgi:DNA primase